MTNLKISFAIIVTTALFSACNKEQVQKEATKSPLNFPTHLMLSTLKNSANPYIDFSNIGISDGVTSSSFSHFYGALYANQLDSGEGYLNVGTISISNSNGNYIKSHSNTPPYFQTNIAEKNALFGTSATVFFSGNTAQNIDTFQESMYLPLPVAINSNNSINIHPSKNYHIEWNVDANNQNGVVVGIYYSALLNQTVKAEMPSTDKIWTQSLVDNGSFQIPASVLADFPSGSYIDIYVGRASASPVQLAPGKTINLFSSSYCKLQRKLD